jgi:hypothetical protein
LLEYNEKWNWRDHEAPPLNKVRLNILSSDFDDGDEWSPTT